MSPARPPEGAHSRSAGPADRPPILAFVLSFFGLVAAVLCLAALSPTAEPVRGIESVRANAPSDARFQRKIAKDGSPYFVLLALNGQIIGKSEMYSRSAAMENGIKSVLTNGASAVVKGLD